MKEQCISFYLNDHYLNQPLRIKKAIQTIAAAGFKSVIIFRRGTICELEDARFIDGVKIACDEAVKNDIQPLLPIEPCNISKICVRRYPDSAQVQLVRGSGTIKNGKFLIKFPWPMYAYAFAHNVPVFIGIQVAFLRNCTGIHQLTNLRYYADFVHDFYGEMYQQEVEHIMYRQRIGGKFLWYIEGETDLEGELIIYAGFRLTERVDVASEDLGMEFNRILNLYRDVPAGGIVWDEPFAESGEWGPSYKAGKSFVDLFKKLHSYDLLSEVYLLDEEGDPHRTAKIRHDYYATMTQALYNLQSRFYARAKECYGNGIGLASHHTWQGEGGINDFPAGVFDYFTLTQYMSAGFVDACWWDDRSVAYTLILANSLGKAYHSGKSFSNCYNWGTTRREQDFQTRLMALHRVNWFAMNYGDECEGPNCYPFGRQWQGQVDGVARLNQVNKFLGGAVNHPDIAIWHGWEGIARMNNAGMAHFWKSFAMNSAYIFQDYNVPFDFVSSEILQEGEIVHGHWKTRMGEYGVVVFGYAVMIPGGLFAKIKEFIGSGGTVIFLGCPPACTVIGEDISRDFAELVGITPINFLDYIALTRERLPIPNSRQSRIDFQYPLSLTDADSLIDTEGDQYGAKAHARSVYYLTGLDPQEKLVKLVQEISGCDETIHVALSEAYWRIYEGNEEERYLLAMAKSRKRMRGFILTGDVRFSVKGDGMIILKFAGGHFVTALGEDLIEFTLNGKPVNYQRLAPGPAVERKQWQLPDKPLDSSLITD